MTPVGIIGFILFDTWCKSPQLYFHFSKIFKFSKNYCPKISVFYLSIQFELLPIFEKFSKNSQKFLHQRPKTIFSVHNMLHTETAAWGLMKWGVKWIEFWGHWFIESKHFWTTVDTPITGIIQFPFYMFLRVKFKLIHQSDPWGVNLTSLDFFSLGNEFHFRKLWQNMVSKYQLSDFWVDRLKSKNSRNADFKSDWT